jgi:hypothetical protein
MEVEHNANLGDGFRSQQIKGPPHKLANYYVLGAPSFERLIEIEDLHEEPNVYAKAITGQ